MIGCSKPEVRMLNVAFPEKLSEIKIDPAQIRYASEANLIRSIYTQIFEYDEDGKIFSKILKSYRIEGRRVELEINSEFKISSGRSIDSEDILLTLKRLLKENSNTHNKLDQFLDLSEKPIFVNRNCVYLTLDRAENFSALLNALASIDYSVIPKEALDNNLEIISYEVTTGPYTIKNLNLNLERAELVKNKHHYRNSNRMADVVFYQYIPVEKIVEVFKKGEVDVIPTYYVMPFTLIEEVKKQRDTNEFLTNFIRLFYFEFSDKKFSQFSQNERKQIANHVREVMYKKYDLPNKFTRTVQFFPEKSEIGLTLKQIEQLIKDTSKSEMSAKFSIGVISSRKEAYTQTFEGDKFVKIVSIEESPDIYPQVVDTLFGDSFTSISYNLNVGTFHYDKDESRKMIDHYLSLNSDQERLDYIRKIHYDILAEGRVIPLGHAPYVAISNKKWELKLSKFFAGTPVWGILRAD